MDFGRKPLHVGPDIDDVGIQKPTNNRWKETRHVEGAIGISTRLVVFCEEAEIAVVKKDVTKDIMRRVK